MERRESLWVWAVAVVIVVVLGLSAVALFASPSWASSFSTAYAPTLNTIATYAWQTAIAPK